MGDVQSSQAAPSPEQDAKTPTREAPWSPDNITDSSDEEPVAAREEVVVPAETDHPPDPMHTLPQRTPSKPQSQVPVQDLKSQKRGTSTGENATIDPKDVNEASDSLRPSTKKVKHNKFELRQKKATASPTASVSKDDRLSDTQSTNRQKSESQQSSVETAVAPSTSNPTNSRHPCPLVNTYDCNQTFASKRSAMRHAELHSGSQKFPCSICTKAYSRPDVLNAHLRSHSKQELDKARTLTQKQRQLQSDDVEQNEHDNEDSLSASELRKNLVETSEEQSTAMENNTTPEAVTQSMAKTSTVISGQPLDTDIVEETPRPKSRLKRKRDILQTNLPTSLSVATSRKRRRKHSLSPPASIASSDNPSTTKSDPTNDIEDHEISLPDAPPPTRLDPILAKNRPPDNVLKPSVPNSQLHQPTRDHRSPRMQPVQRVQVIVPQTSQAEPSTEATKRPKQLPVQVSDDLAEDVTPIAGKTRQTILTSPKGKRRAESGVTYSSPSRHMDNSDEDEEFEPEGMATSVAKRGRSEGAVRNKPKRIRPKSKSTQLAVNAEDVPSATDDDEEVFACPECQLEFKTEAKLKKHSKGHEQEAHEGDDVEDTGRKGAFKPWEVKKLTDWRDNFCEDNAISVPTFNQMMTDSCRRGKDFIWPYRSIAKDDFLQEYFDLLPGRDRRSMRRYRERQFQNVPASQEWTPDDDEELIQLVKELGQKWVEIGQRMTRTQDSVSQRWRFRLQYYGTMNFGEWLPAEEENLKDAVDQIKKDLRLSLDPFENDHVPWESVSRKLDGTRSAQQCSNKWRLMHLVRKGNKFVKPNSIDRMLGTPRAAATPSKMSQRLSGAVSSGRQQGSSSRRKHLSATRVQASDEESHSDANVSEDESDEEGRSDINSTEGEPNAGATQDASDALDDVTSQASSIRDSSPSKKRRSTLQRGQTEGSAEVETPMVKRNPLSTRTPGRKGLSQAFAQTQANTSALRAPTTTRKAHTQSDMPTPGIPITKRPTSSAWLAVNRGNIEAPDDDEDAIMAEPESSDDQMRPIELKANSAGNEDSSEVSSSESDEEEDDNGEADVENGKEEDSKAETEMTSDSASNSSSSSSRSGSTGSDAEESEDDGMVHDTQKDSFIQSLQSPNNRSSFSFRAPASSGVRRSQSKIDWENVLRGKEPIQDDSDSDSEDEGDIMHH